MKTPRQHLRLNYSRKSPLSPAASPLDASRKRLLALALGASLGAASGCGEFEAIPPMPADSGISWDAGAVGDSGIADDAGVWSDAGEGSDSGAEDSGEIPPMPPPRSDASSPDSGLTGEDIGSTEHDSGEVPPMPPPQRDTGVSQRDVGPISRDVRREP